jgi:hypothetical protein
MKGELTTQQIFAIVVMLIAIVIFIAMALWFKGYGSDFVRTLPGMIPGFFIAKRRLKGLDINMSILEFIMLLFLVVIVITFSYMLYSGLLHL